MTDFFRVAPSVALARGEALEVLGRLRGEPFAALVTDPPSGIGFMNKAWDTFAAADAFVAEFAPIFAEALRLMVPGAFGAVWALPRTSHWTGWALERAGFELRDSIHHVQGQGFPKSLDVAKAIDKAAGVTPLREEPATLGMARNPQWHALKKRLIMPETTTGDARAWAGWGTALAPRHEVWWLVRKPFRGTVARNVLERGAGAINIGACRIPPEPGAGRPRDGEQTAAKRYSPSSDVGLTMTPGLRGGSAQGRHPANFAITHAPECSADGTCAHWCPVRLLDEQAGPRTSNGNPSGYVRKAGSFGYKQKASARSLQRAYRRVGAASAFFPVFYCPKPTSRERNAGLAGLSKKTAAAVTGRRPGSRGLVMAGGKANPFAGPSGRERQNHHPCPKPVGLLRWLARLVAPPGATVLDPFAGSASVGVAAIAEGFGYFGIERDRDADGSSLGYVEVALGRLRHALDI